MVKTERCPYCDKDIEIDKEIIHPYEKKVLLKCGHRYRRVVRTLEDRVSVSDSVTIKSQKARKIDHTITQSPNNSILSFLVFGPGRNPKEFHLYRVPVKSLIERMGQVAAFPEDVKIPSQGDSIAKELADNPAIKELNLMKEYDYTIILLISAGSISEFSMFMSKQEIAYKIRLYIPQKYRGSSFLMTKLFSLESVKFFVLESLDI
jgi:hypothetical protein